MTNSTTTETLGFEAIMQTVTGEGHFLGSGHTMAAMQRDYFYPTLADRDDPLSWAENGALTLWDRAKTRAKWVLDTHFPSYLDTTTDARIRDRFDIRLDRSRMQPTSIA